MDELSALQALGLELPSPACIFGAIVFGVIGLAAGRIPCVADGEGRNSVWLARKGFVVDAFDVVIAGEATSFPIDNILYPL